MLDIYFVEEGVLVSGTGSDLLLALAPSVDLLFLLVSVFSVDPFLKSVAYQPLPFSLNPGAEISLI